MRVDERNEWHNSAARLKKTAIDDCFRSCYGCGKLLMTESDKEVSL